MKRVDLIRHLERNGCEFLREGNNHTVYVNRLARRSSSLASAAQEALNGQLLPLSDPAVTVSG